MSDNIKDVINAPFRYDDALPAVNSLEDDLVQYAPYLLNEAISGPSPVHSNANGEVSMAVPNDAQPDDLFELTYPPSSLLDGFYTDMALTRRDSFEESQNVDSIGALFTQHISSSSPASPRAAPSSLQLTDINNSVRIQGMSTMKTLTRKDRVARYLAKKRSKTSKSYTHRAEPVRQRIAKNRQRENGKFKGSAKFVPLSDLQ